MRFSLKCPLLLILIFYYTVSYSQTSVIDSLLAKLKTAAEDTNKVKILYELSENCEANEDIMSYAQQSLDLSQKLNYKKGIADAYNNIGYVYDNRGQVERALQFYTKSLIVQEEIHNKAGIAAAIINIGSIYNGQGERAKALEKNLRGYAIYKELGDKVGMANALNNIGAISGTLGKSADALKYYKQSLEIQRSIHDKNGMAYSFINIGSNYMSHGELDSAIKSFSQALAIRQEMNSKQGISSCLSSIGLIYFMKKDFVQAQLYCEKGLKIAQDIGMPILISQSSKRLSDIYSAIGDYKKALKMHVLYKQMSDSLKNDETQKVLVKNQMQYEFEKQEAQKEIDHQKELAIVEEKGKRQKVISYSVIGGLIIVLLFSVIIFNRLRITRKQKKIIESQKLIVEASNKNITDSITYAERIQNAILPNEDLFKSTFSDSFIFFKPKAIVSGDFYWAEKKDDKIFFAVVDCTGHGVPGAFMSMIGHTLLNEIVNEKKITEPNEILNQLKQGVIQTLNQSDDINTQQDGMEIALCVFDSTKNIIEFSGSYNVLYHFRNTNLTEYKGDTQSIGYEKGKNNSFTKHTIEVKTGDTFYIFSDGFPDQRGGKDKKKFYYQPFKKMLGSIVHLPMKEQEQRLDQTLKEWMGSLDQIDDILVIGVKI